MNQIGSRTQKEWMELHADVLIPHASPRFYLGRTSAGNVCRLAFDLPDSIGAELMRLAGDEPVSSEPEGGPVFADKYVRLLEELAPVTRKWTGPAFRFPKRGYAHSHEVIQVTKENIDLLQPNHADWVPAVGRRDPVCVLLVEGEVMRQQLLQAGHQWYVSQASNRFTAPRLIIWLRNPSQPSLGCYR